MVFNGLYSGKIITGELLIELGFIVNGTSNFMVRYVMGEFTVNLLFSGEVDIFHTFNHIKRYSDNNLVYDDLLALYNLLCK